MENILNFKLEDLEKKLVDLGGKKFNATQVFEWLYRKKINNLSEMSNISKKFLQVIEDNFYLKRLHISKRQESVDGTVKYLFELNEGEFIETVLMRQKYGNSVCVTTQLGCNMGCEFCASGLVKKRRDLTSGEIVAQILEISKLEDIRVSHVVIMGIGEPFDNYKNVMDFIRIVNYAKGLEIGARHITVSTSGLCNEIEAFAEEDIQVNLAVSLHAPNDEIRSSIMPINKKHNVEQLINSIKYYIEKTNRRVTLEYILIDGLNDKLEHALELADLIWGMNVYINLIPYNPVSENGFDRTKEETANKFYDALKKRKLNVVLRKEFGTDIDAACGQLRSKKKDENIMEKEIFVKLREQGFRITEPRKAIIAALEGKHLTFKQLREEMVQEGFKNIATLYNNIDFLLDNKLITEVHINNVKYYDLTIEDFSHSGSNYIHVISKKTNHIKDIIDNQIFEELKSHPKLTKFDIDSIHIAIRTND